MKRISLIITCCCFLLLSTSIVKAEENQATVTEQMKGDLQNSGVAAGDIKAAESSMNELVKGGTSPQEASSIVSQTVKQAHSQGLKGKDLAAKVHEAVKARKAQHKAAEGKVEEAKGKTKKLEKQFKEKAKGKGKK
jgi:hypothetical protein